MSTEFPDPLRHPAALVREVVGLLREPVAALDGALRVVALSGAFQLEFGVSETVCAGRPLFEMGGGEWDGPELRDLLLRVAPGSDAVEEYPAMLRSGRRVRLSVRPLRRGANQIELLLLSVRSEPEHAEPLPEPELLRLVGESSADLVALFRADGTCLYAGTASEPLLGYTRQELLGTRPCGLLHRDDLKRVLAQLRRVDVDPRPISVSARVRRKDGRFVWLETTCRSVAGPDGEPIVHTSSRDVTERKRAEEALQWLGRQTKLILDSAAEGIFGVDRAGTLTFINPAAARVLGYPVSELLGHGYQSFFSPPGEATDDVIRATLDDGAIRFLAEHPFVRRGGARVPVELSCTPARDHGEVVGAVVTFRDVTERKEAVAALRRAEWLAGVGETVIALRHEINNPLTTLLAEATLLEMGGNTPEEEREMVAAICEQARRIRDVVRRLTERQDSPSIRVEGGLRMLDLS